jgi:hypothetical protein
MKHIIPQIISLYGTQNVQVDLIGNLNRSGRPNSVLPNATNPGLFLLSTPAGAITSVNNICQILSISIPSGAYVPGSINFLSAPTPPITGCSEDCIQALMDYFTTHPTVANVNIETVNVATATILDNQYGVTVLRNDGTISFVNTCKISVIG